MTGSRTCLCLMFLQIEATAAEKNDRRLKVKELRMLNNKFFVTFSRASMSNNFLSFSFFSSID